MSISLSTSRNSKGVPLRHHWSVCVGAGRANEVLRAAWQQQLVRARRECGFRYIRFHGLFHDDMFVYRENNGHRTFNWRYVDDVFDRLLEIGVKPFVELGFCPGDLATEKGTVFWWKAHGSPPKDFAVWEELVERLVRHCVERYGVEEVRTWYFEVWNEPNLNCFWRGTREDYFRLYRHSAAAVKRVDSQLRVGGPATSNFVPDDRFAGDKEDISRHAEHAVADINSLPWRGVWIEEFLDECRRHKLPVDFVSCHPYPADWATDGKGGWKNYIRGVTALRDDLQWLRKTVAASSFPTAEIHCTEWNHTSSCGDKAHDELCIGAYVLEANLLATELADSVSYWTFTDIFEEGGGMPGPFHGGFGMINAHGLAKPVYHAYRFLYRLGDEELFRADGGIVTRDSQTGRLTALAWNYPGKWRTGLPLDYHKREPILRALNTGESRTLDIDLSGIAPHTPFALETVDRTAGSAVDAWRGMGMPESPAQEHIEALRGCADAGRMEFVAADARGSLRLQRTLTPWAFAILRELPVSAGEAIVETSTLGVQPMQET